MQHAQHEHGRSDRSEDGSSRPATVSHLGSAQPRHALQHGDDPQDGNGDSHRRQGTAPMVRPALYAWVAPLLTALSWGAVSLFALHAGASASPVEAADGGASAPLTPLIALLLGALQGATEFLPVSSSGHLSLGQAWLGIDPQSAGHRFNITVHAGTLLAVLWVYRTDVAGLLRACLRPTVASEERTLLGMMLLASLPLGIVLIPQVEAWVVAMESRVRWIGVALWFTAIVLFLAFRHQARMPPSETTAPPKPWQAFAIGCAQVVAVLPGISRSGTTIAAGLAVGLDRASAARFSFLISLIAVGGASAKEVLEALVAPETGAATQTLPFILGFVSSLAVGLASLRALLFLVQRGRVKGFVIYLMIVGTIAIVVG